VPIHLKALDLQQRFDFVFYSGDLNYRIAFAAPQCTNNALSANDGDVHAVINIGNGNKNNNGGGGGGVDGDAGATTASHTVGGNLGSGGGGGSGGSGGGGGGGSGDADQVYLAGDSAAAPPDNATPSLDEFDRAARLVSGDARALRRL
jgi:hypothetical protein